MTKDVIKLFTKIFLASLPLLSLLVLYLCCDPWKVLYSYSNYYSNIVDQVPLDRDYCSAETLLKNYPDSRFDSYIFGSSHALSFLCSEWDKYTNGKSFHFDASGETIFGIVTKLSYLQNHNMPVKYCLLIVDSATIIETKNSKGNAYIKHPLISGENRFSFQFTFLTTFLSNRFFVPYIFFKFNKTAPKFMEYPTITENRNFSFDTHTNDMMFTFAEKQMQENINSYYSDYKRFFVNHDSTKAYTLNPVISEEQLKTLNKIKQIFMNEGTIYKIIIYPGFEMRRLNPADIKKLKEIFGEDNVYDYSGKNDITTNITNYYDDAHCRTLVGNRILKEIYSVK